MSIFKRNSLLVFGLLAALPLTALQAQTEHDGHHPAETPPPQAAPEAGHPQKPQGGMMNHDGMGHGSMGASPQPPKGSDEKSPKHDH